MTQARAAFAARFGGEPAVAGCAPGRVELLGNHTDYNGGLVMAAAIDRSTVVVGRRIDGGEAKVVSVNFGQTDDFSLDEIERTEAGAWTPVCPRRLLGLDRVARAPRVGLRGVDRRRCSPRGRPFQLGEPSGVGRLVLDSARPSSRPIQPRLQRQSRRPASHGTGQGAAAVGK